MSITNTLKEVMFAVQSTKFIAECDSYDEMNEKKVATDLFTMTQNAEFVALSKLTTGNTLNVNWNSVKNWLFSNSPNNCSDDKMLKAFVRTQIYRPLFFKYDNYTYFTQKLCENIYRCDTTKGFIDHNGIERKIVFKNWPDSFEVDKAGSGLPDTATYTIPEDEISFYNISNKFEYFIYYNPVKIVQDKFVLNDVEFYAVRPDGTVVNTIYFNEFQNNTEGQNQVSKVVYDTTSEKYKFRLNGMDYVIEGNEISIDAATKVFDETKDDADHAKYKEWKCEIVDDRFCFDDTWYLLERDDSGDYTYVKYADNKDNKLIELDVTPQGYAEYKPWEMQFQFNSTWTQVQVVKKHQSDVVDRLKDEWCEFDGTTEEPNNIVFTEHKTYDWYLANEILRIQEMYQTQAQALLNLGGGNVYNGALELTTNETLGTECTVRIRNDIQNEDVVTICELVKKYGENDLVQQMGTLFDRDLNLDNNRVIRGNMDSAGLVGVSTDGTKAFFVKEFGKGLNNVNTAWLDYSTWSNSWQIVPDVGEIAENVETHEFNVNWGLSDYIETDGVKLSPVYGVDEEGNQTSDVIKYQITIGNGLKQYTVWVNLGFVHFLVNGNRYRVNLETNKVDRLVVNDIHASTVDFSTSYNPTQLRDNLAQNVKTTMLNQIVQAVVDSTRSSSGTIAIDFKRPIGKYLDLFTDAACLDNYVQAWNLDVESDECAKFSQVYKNNLDDIDESNIVNGNVYGHLRSNIERTFRDGTTGNQKQSILVVDSPSIEVRRTSVEKVDTFTYKVLMDVHIIQNKSWMSEKFKRNKSGYDKKYVIANAIVQDMECSVKFTPKYNPSTGSITYDVLYSVDKSKNYVVKYNQIVYNYNGKTKLKTIAPEEQITVNFSTLSGLDLTYFIPDKPLSSITEEFISKNIEKKDTETTEKIFKKAGYTSMFMFINNRISSTKAQVIDNSVVDNPGMPGSIWGIGQPIPGDLPGELVSVSRGWTYIRGQVYNVSSDDTKLIPTTSGTQYNITPIPANEYETQNVIEVLVKTGDTSWTLKYMVSYSGGTSPVLNVSSNIANATPFDSDGDGAYNWIESQFFSGESEKTVKVVVDGSTTYESVVFWRGNFGVRFRQTW